MKRNTKLLFLAAVLIVMSTGCYTYQQSCAAYSYDDTLEVETNEENS